MTYICQKYNIIAPDGPIGCFHKEPLNKLLILDAAYRKGVKITGLQ